jgi:subtilisin family serine protease
MGHGSMVASVAATSNGVAPGALLGSYRVFGCSGYAVDDVIIEAIDRAVRDGCDVINLSLASGSGFASTVSSATSMPAQPKSCCAAYPCFQLQFRKV